MILASAGSGKTYALTNRFVMLLALGVAPEKLIALTFTRKAAAEFLDEILQKLARAASDPNHAATIASQIGVADFSQPRATELLRSVLDHLHVLTLGTLDSFFNRVLHCFPAEFGLASNFEVMEPHEATTARRQVFEQLFQNGDLHRSFTEAFKLATFGAEEKQMVRTFDQFVGRYHQTYLQAPDAALWAEEKAIWPQGCRWLRGIGDVDLECDQLSVQLNAIGFDRRSEKMWEDFLAMVRGMKPGKALPKPKALQERLFSHYEVIHAGGPLEIPLYGKTYHLGSRICNHLSRLLDYLMHCEVFPNVMRTRGIHTVLAAYEEIYHDRVRRGGKLGFDDIQLLLSGALLPQHAQNTLSLENAEALLNIEYRLDGQFDHWLLDEFQDTSLRQWNVLENLADEVIQDGSGTRSFFYVGDVKQAIFGWRGGDSRLFFDIFEHYGREQISKRELNTSYRSSPVVLDAVNRVFGDRSLFGSLFAGHPELVERWFDSWETHVSNFDGREGFVQLIHLPKSGWDDEESPMEKRIGVLAQILRDLAPHENDLSCAVLVRRNDSATQVAESIRANTDVPVVVDGDTLIGSDHPIAASYLALIQLAAHPGDTLAWKHLCMSPALSGNDWDQAEGTRRELVESTIQLVHDRGFKGAFEGWLERLQRGGFTPDEFAKRRIEQLRQATLEFDQSGNRSFGDFVKYAKGFVARESPAKGVVQVMTIHKSKGLGFDAVIVAEIEGTRDQDLTDIGRLDLVTHERGEGLGREIEWVFSMPRKLACDLDPILGAARYKLENEAAFQELCVLYVALTRAKFANYIICTEPDEKASMRTLVSRALVSPDQPGEPREFGKQACEVAFQAGTPDWYRKEVDPDETPLLFAESEFQPNRTVSSRRRFGLLRREMPSSAADEAAEPKQGASFVFLPGTIESAEYGTMVHELFELFPWIDALSSDEIRERLNAKIDNTSSVQCLARDEVLSNLLKPEVAAVFQQAKYYRQPIAWLEKRFELVHAARWISGTFDRVVLRRDAEGRFDRAYVYDFKTNKVRTEEDVSDACSHYAPQLAIYRLALGKLLGIDESDVYSHLIFTRLAKVVEVSQPF